MADAWRPTSELERRLHESVRAGDQEGYFRVLADSELVLPVAPDVVDDVLANTTQPTWPTQEDDGRVHVLTYTSAAAMRACLGPGYRHFMTVRFGDIAQSWPDAAWWLAVDVPGHGVDAALPIEARLPSWFVRQVAEGDGRPPRVGRPGAAADGPWEELRGQHRDLPRETRRPEFQPANDVERELLRAAANNDHDLFLQTLAGTEVLLPVPEDTDYSLRPGRPGFPWQTRDVDGATVVPVFTSPERLIEAARAAGTGTEYIRLPFTVALRYWPHPDWQLAINSGSPAGGTVQAQQLPGLATWADQRAAQRMTEGFEPQNEIEQRLFDAARRRDTDAFYKILLGAQVLVPADPDTPWGVTPDDPAFPWQPVNVHGRTSIQVFTSPKWMNDALSSSRFVMPALLDMLAAWPDTAWTFVLNPGTPIDASLPGDQARALAGRAVPEETATPPSAATPPPPDAPAVPVAPPVPAAPEPSDADPGRTALDPLDTPGARIAPEGRGTAWPPHDPTSAAAPAASALPGPAADTIGWPQHEPPATPNPGDPQGEAPAAEPPPYAAGPEPSAPGNPPRGSDAPPHVEHGRTGPLGDPLRPEHPASGNTGPFPTPEAAGDRPLGGDEHQHAPSAVSDRPEDGRPHGLPGHSTNTDAAGHRQAATVGDHTPEAPQGETPPAPTPEALGVPAQTGSSAEHGTPERDVNLAAPSGTGPLPTPEAAGDRPQGGDEHEHAPSAHLPAAATGGTGNAAPHTPPGPEPGEVRAVGARGYGPEAPQNTTPSVTAADRPEGGQVLGHPGDLEGGDQPPAPGAAGHPALAEGAGTESAALYGLPSRSTGTDDPDPRQATTVGDHTPAGPQGETPPAATAVGNDQLESLVRPARTGGGTEHGLNPPAPGGTGPSPTPETAGDRPPGHDEHQHAPSAPLPATGTENAATHGLPGREHGDATTFGDRAPAGPQGETPPAAAVVGREQPATPGALGSQAQAGGSVEQGGPEHDALPTPEAGDDRPQGGDEHQHAPSAPGPATATGGTEAAATHAPPSREHGDATTFGDRTPEALGLPPQAGDTTAQGAPRHGINPPAPSGTGPLPTPETADDRPQGRDEHQHIPTGGTENAATHAPPSREHGDATSLGDNTPSGSQGETSPAATAVGNDRPATFEAFGRHAETGGGAGHGASGHGVGLPPAPEVAGDRPLGRDEHQHVPSTASDRPEDGRPRGLPGRERGDARTGGDHTPAGDRGETSPGATGAGNEQPEAFGRPAQTDGGAEQGASGHGGAPAATSGTGPLPTPGAGDERAQGRDEARHGSAGGPASAAPHTLPGREHGDVGTGGARDHGPASPQHTTPSATTAGSPDGSPAGDGSAAAAGGDHPQPEGAAGGSGDGRGLRVVPDAGPGFEPGNRIDQELYDATLAGDSDAFLRVLLNANVLVPIPDDAPLEVTPVQRDFRWDAALRDDAAVRVFTSLVRLREILPEETRFVYADFRELIGAWPRADWAMLLNPGTRIGASLRGEQVRALSEWAIRVGLIQARPAAPPPREAEPEPQPQPQPRPEPQTQPRPEAHPAVSPQPVADPDDRVSQLAIMQKVVPHGHVGWYLEQGYDRVGGFVHLTSDVAELQTPAQLYEALGLLYDDSPFAPGDDGVYVIRWPAYCPDVYRVPFGGATEAEMAAWGESGWVVERAPFVGTGFAPGSAGSIREFKVDSIRLPYGAEMYYLAADRSERFVAMYDPDRLGWLRPDAGAEGWDGRTEAAQ